VRDAKAESGFAYKDNARYFQLSYARTKAKHHRMPRLIFFVEVANTKGLPVYLRDKAFNQSR
jgi:hypothetical protein